jgi:hypothetical protein
MGNINRQDAKCPPGQILQGRAGTVPHRTVRAELHLQLMLVLVFSSRARSTSALREAKSRTQKSTTWWGRCSVLGTVCMAIFWYRPVPPVHLAALSAGLGRRGPGLRKSRRHKNEVQSSRWASWESPECVPALPWPATRASILPGRGAGGWG